MRFEPGQIMATSGALKAMEQSGEVPMTVLAKHVRGDWGVVDDEDKVAHDRTQVEGRRLLSAYRLWDETKIWVITEADRRVTTLLLPSEY